jgi:predicted AlkP superfamily phosphohydrolase/phosphomutase
MMLYQRSASGLRGAATAAQVEAYQKAYPGFHDEVFHDYEDGLFGKTLMQGGDGLAERRLLETVRLDCEFLKSGTRWAWQTFRPDVLTHYTPSSDGAGHTWMGILDQNKPGHNPALAAKVWPFYKEVFKLQDGWLGTILEIAGSDTVVALVSDHGMAGASKFFNVNAVLEQAGILARTPADSYDLAKTKALAPPGGEFFVSINGTDRKGGIVPPEDKEELLKQIQAALLSAKDPQTGAPIVVRVYRPADLPDLGLAGEPCGDLYMDLAAGYYPSGRLAKEIVSPMPEANGGGVHGFYPKRRDMHAIFYLYGPGVKKGTLGPQAYQVDVAPTLARLIGIPAPKQAVGKVVEALLAGG